MKIKLIITFLVFPLLIIPSGCKEVVDETVFVRVVPQNSSFMTFDSAQVVTRFPKIYPIDEGKSLFKEFIGMKDFEVVDSLIVITTKFAKLWSIYTLPKFDSLGSFLSLGEAPKEFGQVPIVSDKVHFEVEENKIIALIYEFTKGGLLKFNVNQSISFGQDSIEVIEDDLPQFLFDFLIIDSGYYYFRQPEQGETKQNRYLLYGGNLSSNSTIEQLNRAEISNGMMDFSLLLSMTRISPDRDKILEMYFRLNYFNLYSLDGSLKKTISIESTLDDLSKLQKVPHPERNYRFSDVRVYDKFFALLHLNELEQDFAVKRKSYPEILIFDWEGNPISKLIFKDFFTSFDFDLNNQAIYTFDSQTDEFKIHDLPSF